MYTFHWLTPDRFKDLETLFGPRGAFSGCWCMFWRLTQKEFAAGCAAAPGSTASGGGVEVLRGQANHDAFRALVNSGIRPGILAYDGAVPVGWCALAPRVDYPRLSRSKILAPVDDTPVWSITCFFIAKGYRRKGLTVELLLAAVDMVRERGGGALEGYPVEPKSEKTPDAYAYTGLASAFRKAGFVEVARRSETRPIMRREIS